jgi:hypothetical protein
LIMHQLLMTKVMQMRAAIARSSSAGPTHLDLMGTHAYDCAGSTRLITFLADPDYAVA